MPSVSDLVSLFKAGNVDWVNVVHDLLCSEDEEDQENALRAALCEEVLLDWDLQGTERDDLLKEVLSFEHVTNNPSRLEMLVDAILLLDDRGFLPWSKISLELGLALMAWLEKSDLSEDFLSKTVFRALLRLTKATCSFDPKLLWKVLKMTVDKNRSRGKAATRFLKESAVQAIQVREQTGIWAGDCIKEHFVHWKELVSEAIQIGLDDLLFVWGIYLPSTSKFSKHCVEETEHVVKEIVDIFRERNRWRQLLCVVESHAWSVKFSGEKVLALLREMICPPDLKRWSHAIGILSNLGAEFAEAADKECLDLMESLFTENHENVKWIAAWAFDDKLCSSNERFCSLLLDEYILEDFAKFPYKPDFSFGSQQFDRLIKLMTMWSIPMQVECTRKLCKEKQKTLRDFLIDKTAKSDSVLLLSEFIGLRILQEEIFDDETFHRLLCKMLEMRQFDELICCELGLLVSVALKYRPMSPDAKNNFLRALANKAFNPVKPLFIEAFLASKDRCSFLEDLTRLLPNNFLFMQLLVKFVNACSLQLEVEPILKDKLAAFAEILLTDNSVHPWYVSALKELIFDTFPLEDILSELASRSKSKRRTGGKTIVMKEVFSGLPRELKRSKFSFLIGLSNEKQEQHLQNIAYLGLKLPLLKSVNPGEDHLADMWRFGARILKISNDDEELSQMQEMLDKFFKIPYPTNEDIKLFQHLQEMLRKGYENLGEYELESLKEIMEPQLVIFRTLLKSLVDRVLKKENWAKETKLSICDGVLGVITFASNMFKSKLANSYKKTWWNGLRESQFRCLKRFSSEDVFTAFCDVAIDEVQAQVGASGFITILHKRKATGPLTERQKRKKHATIASENCLNPSQLRRDDDEDKGEDESQENDPFSVLYSSISKQSLAEDDFIASATKFVDMVREDLAGTVSDLVVEERTHVYAMNKLKTEITSSNIDAKLSEFREHAEAVLKIFQKKATIKQKQIDRFRKLQNLMDS